MGSIHKRLLKDGSARWQAMVAVNGKQMGKRFKRKKDAEDWISRLKVDVNDGTYRELKKASFDQYIEHWKKTHLIEAPLQAVNAHDSSMRSGEPDLARVPVLSDDGDFFGRNQPVHGESAQ